MGYQVKNAVAIFIFLRLESTLMLIDRLREVQPKKIYIVGEGYRPSQANEEDKVLEIRRIVEESIDWDCQILTNYVPIDIGAGPRISSGITWVFEHEEQAIFLEDDTIPSISFFKYCDELLEYYKENPSIMAISGNNVISNFPITDSYTFSSIPFIWGWASWRRAWKDYDYGIKSWPELKKTGVIQSKIKNPMFYEIRENEFNLAFNGIHYTWDYQFAYLLLEKSGLCIVPKVNMIENVGIGPNSTNTKDSYDIEDEKASDIEFPLVHPTLIEVNENYDEYYFKNFLFKLYYHSAYVRFKYRIKKILGKRLTSLLRPKLKRK